MTESRQLIGNRFEIADQERDLLGRGGMGDVYRGMDLQTGQPVAIKALRLEVVASDPNALARFLREGEALRQLNHPNIVQVVEGLEANGRHYLVMEYVPGGSLGDLLEGQGRLPIDRTVEIALDVADALTRAHRLGILHRDLKPSNVLLAEDGTPRLTDFGHAHLATGPRLTQTGTVVGTVFYLSPEACRGEPLDARADVWAFGAMLYEMLTGEPPFPGETFPAVFMAILSQPVPDLSQARPEVPDALADLVYRTLEKDLSRRISSMRRVGAELEAILAALPYPSPAVSRPSPPASSRFATPTPPTEGVQSSPPARATPVPPQAERRMATVLVAEVSGVAQLLDELGAEDWFEAVEDLHHILGSEVERYGGEVDQLHEGRLVALYGAQVAHEDDPERAILAALVIRDGISRYAGERGESAGVELDLRAGITTGQVIAAGRGERGEERRTTGEAIALAGRVQAAAEPGAILVSDRTYRLVHPLFEWQALGEVQVTGVNEPIALYRPVAHRVATGKGRGIEDLESPLVGRDDEFRALQDAVEGLRAGIGGIVTVVGEAGIGKSRLVAELRKAVGAQTDSGPRGSPLRWAEGRCLSYATNVAYQLWLDWLRGLLGVVPDAPPATVRGALRERVHALCPDCLDQVYPYLGRMMSLPLERESEATLRGLDAESLRFITFRAVETLLTRAATWRPWVVVCEDLHWADPTSLALLEHLLPLVDRAPLLFICALRPEREHPCWQIIEIATRHYPHCHTDLLLRPLSVVESAALVGNLLHLEDLPQALRHKILDRAEGNPFYVEEILRSLIDGGIVAHDDTAGRWRATRDVEDIPIPDTLHGVIAARIDRLPGETRRVLQLACVIGRLFTYPVLSAIYSPLPPGRGGGGEGDDSPDPHLIALQRAQLVRLRTRLPEREYAFKHVLTQEATYGGLLRRERRATHRRVAEALERLYPERIEEQLGLLAHHWEQAREVGRAVEYLYRAGEQSAAQYANAEAVAYLSRALDLTPEEDHAARFALLLAREGALDLLGDREAQARDLAVLERLAEDSEDDRGRAQVALRKAHHAIRTQDYPAAFATAQAAIDAARTTQDLAMQAAGYRELGRALRYSHELEAAHVQLERALTLAREAGSHQVEVDALHELGSLTLFRDYDRCEPYANEQLRICREMGNKRDEGRALRDLGFLYYHRGEWSRAMTCYEGSLRVCRETGNRRDEAWAGHMLGYVHLSLGDYAGAKAWAVEALALHRKTGDRVGQAWTLTLLGAVCLQLGDGAGAREWLVESARADRGSGQWFKVQIILLRGDLAVRVEGSDDQAREHYQRALHLLQEQDDFFGWGYTAHLRLAWMALRAGDRVGALAHVEQIWGYAKAHSTDGWMMPEFLHSHWTCYQVLRACDDPRAEEILDTAYHLLQERAEAIDEETLRRSYLENVAAHREIVAAWNEETQR